MKPRKPSLQLCEQAKQLVSRGVRALKVKVGRRSSPVEDAEALLALRQAIGPGVVLRADANRAWSLQQALQFGHRVHGAHLQYVEEPTKVWPKLEILVR